MRPKVLFEPILGIGTSFQFIRAAKTLADRRARIATLAAFLSTSASAAITTDPSTNFGVGSAVASKISYMRVILARGGSQPVVEYILVPGVKYFVTPESLAGPTVDPKRINKREKSRIIIENMFREHTSRRYTNGLARRVLEPTVLKLFY